MHLGVCMCVCNLSITIYACKGQINTHPQKKKKNLKTQCNSDLIAPEICVERGLLQIYYNFNLTRWFRADFLGTRFRKLFLTNHFL